MTGADAVERRQQRLGRGQLARACISGAFGLAFNSMALFLVPLHARELGLPLATAGWLVGAGALAPALLSVPTGALIDRLGPRRCFVAGTGASALLSLGFLVASGIWPIVALQLVLGFARSVAWVASQVYITRVGEVTDAVAVTGRFSFYTNMGTLGGPLVAGFVAEILGVRLAFAFLALFAIAFTGLGLSLARLPAPRGEQAPAAGTGFAQARGLLRRDGIQVALILTFARLWLSTVWIAFFPLLLVERGVTEALAGAVVAARAGVATVTSLWAAPLSRRVGHEVATGAGLAVGTLGLALSPYTATARLAWVPAALIGLAGGVSLPLLLVLMTSATPRPLHGVAVGLRMMVNQASNAVAPVFAGALIAAVGLATGVAASAAVAALALGGAAWRHLQRPA